MGRLIVAAVLFAAALFSTLAWAQISREDALEARELRMSAFTLLSYNMEPLAGMARGTNPFDREQAVRNAERIAILAPMIPELFETDTRNTGVYNRAKDFVWDNIETFEEHARDLRVSAQALAEAARNAEDRRDIVQPVRDVGGSCGACHDLFRFLESDPGFPFRDQVE